TASGLLRRGAAGPAGAPGEQAFDVLHGDVDLEVDPVARALAPERGDLGGVGDDRGGEPVVEHVDDGQADAVHRARALLHDVAEQLVGHAHPQVGRGGDDLADAVHVPLDDVATQAVAHPDGALEVDRVAGLAIADGRALVGLVGHVGVPPAVPGGDDGQAAAVDGDRVAGARV